MIGDVSATTIIQEGGLSAALSCPNLTKRLTILIKVCRREIVHFAFL